MSEFHTYPKIPGPFKRAVDGPNRNKLIEGRWTSVELDMLADNDWLWTEKVDGTNIRVHWDGHTVRIGGRTDKAVLHKDLLARLEELFPEELFEQMFEEKSVTLFGEGFGAGIQKIGGNYSQKKDFVLFDVLIGSVWLNREPIENIAHGLGVQVVPLIGQQKFTGQRYNNDIWWAIEVVRRGLTSTWGDFAAEGLVGVPVGGFLDRHGKRIMVKIKSCDFKEE